MSLKPFQYYLLEEDGRSNYVQGGIVSTRGIPTPLPNTPDGWQDILIAWERNQAKQGIIRNYSKELGYVLDGATILRDGFYKGNIDRKLYLLIQKLTLEYTTSYRWVYNYLYKGEIDMTTVKDGADKVKVSIMEGGLSKLLKANESTVYTIPFDDDAINVKMDGVKLFNTFNMVLLETVDGGGNFAGLVHTTQDSGKVGGTGVAVFDIPETNNVGSPDLDVLFFGETRLAGRATFSGHFQLKALETNVIISIQVYNNGVFRTQSNVSIIGVTAGSTYDLLTDIQLIEGDRLYFIRGFEYEETTLEMKWEVTYPTSYCKGYRRKDLFKKLVAKICGHEEYAISALLDNDDRIVTCGDAIRALPDAAIKCSLNDFFEDVDTDLMAGLGIENGVQTTNLPAGQRVLLETRTRFYDDSSPIYLGEPTDRPEVSYINDISFNRIKTGWKKPDIEDVNGKYSFNNSQQWSLPIVRINKEYKLTSPFKSDPFEIEWVRINLDGKDTTDSNKDGDNYVLWAEILQADVNRTVSFVAATNIINIPNDVEIRPGQRIRISGSLLNDGIHEISAIGANGVDQTATVAGPLTDEGAVSVFIEFLTGRVYKLKRDTSQASGDPDIWGAPSPATIFNTDLSPKRKLLRHKRWIRSILYNYPGGKLVLSSSDGSANLKATVSGVTVDEDQDINVEDLGLPIFLPYYFDFDALSPVNLAELMEENTNRCFSFDWEGINYTGFLIKAGLAPNTQEKQQYKLLACASNDMTNLI